MKNIPFRTTPTLAKDSSSIDVQRRGLNEQGLWKHGQELKARQKPHSSQK